MRRLAVIRQRLLVFIHLIEHERVFVILGDDHVELMTVLLLNRLGGVSNIAGFRLSAYSGCTFTVTTKTRLDIVLSVIAFPSDAPSARPVLRHRCAVQFLAPDIDVRDRPCVLDVIQRIGV